MYYTTNPRNGGTAFKTISASIASTQWISTARMATAALKRQQ